MDFHRKSTKYSEDCCKRAFGFDLREALVDESSNGLQGHTKNYTLHVPVEDKLGFKRGPQA